MSETNDFTANLILNVNDVRKQEIDLSEFGITQKFFAHTLSSIASHKIFSNSTVLKPGVKQEDSTPDDFEMSDDFIYKLIVESVHDVNNKKVFYEEHIPSLQTKSRALIDCLYKAVDKANKITKQEVDLVEKK